VVEWLVKVVGWVVVEVVGVLVGVVGVVGRHLASVSEGQGHWG